MYLWVVLATFLAMIAGYYLPLRHDTQDIVNVPVAQAKLVQMSAQHKLILTWLKQQAYPYKCYIKKNGGWTNSSSCHQEEIDDEGRGHVPYASNFPILKDGEEGTCANLNNLICLEENSFSKGFDFQYSQEYQSFVVCFKEDRQTLTASCDRSSTNKTARLLLTYGPIPEHWRSYTSDGNFRPSADFMNAMRAQFSPKEMFGYVDLDNTYELINYENKKFEIPGYIAEHYLENYMDDPDQSQPACLVYMSWF